MKKILFVFVILLMVSCSGNGVPLAEAELEDFCSRENAGKKIFIGHKGEAAGSVDLSFSGLFTILQMNAQMGHTLCFLSAKTSQSKSLIMVMFTSEDLSDVMSLDLSFISRKTRQS